MYRKSHCVVIRTHHVLKPFFSLFPTWCQVVPLSLPSVLSLDIFSSFLKTPYMECLEYHLETRLTRIFLFFFLSFTNLMRVWWGIHLGRRPKLGPGGSSREGQISAACAFWSPSPRLERGWFPKLGLWRHPLSPSPRGSLVPLRFLPLASRNSILCISDVVDISPTNLIPACDSSSRAFHMVDSAYKLTKQSNNRQPHCTPFPF